MCLYPSYIYNFAHRTQQALETVRLQAKTAVKDTQEAFRLLSEVFHCGRRDTQSALLEKHIKNYILKGKKNSFCFYSFYSVL